MGTVQCDRGQRGVPRKRGVVTTALMEMVSAGLTEEALGGLVLKVDREVSPASLCPPVCVPAGVRVLEGPTVFLVRRVWKGHYVQGLHWEAQCETFRELHITWNQRDVLTIPFPFSSSL